MPSQALGLGQSGIYDDMPTADKEEERRAASTASGRVVAAVVAGEKRRVRVWERWVPRWGVLIAGGHGAPRPPGRSGPGSVVPY
jgi:hypothetical protein